MSIRIRFVKTLNMSDIIQDLVAYDTEDSCLLGDSRKQPGTRVGSDALLEELILGHLSAGTSDRYRQTSTYEYPGNLFDYGG
jgi:hypothetical protein